MDYYKAVWQKYAVFTGRAQRAEYWYFVLFNIIIGAVLTWLDSLLGFGSDGLGALSGLYALAVIIPGIAVGIRRLHDINKSGWWLFISLVPLIGSIWLIVLLATDSDAGENQYGPNPKGTGTTSTTTPESTQPEENNETPIQ